MKKIYLTLFIIFLLSCVSSKDMVGEYVYADGSDTYYSLLKLNSNGTFSLEFETDILGKSSFNGLWEKEGRKIQLVPHIENSRNHSIETFFETGRKDLPNNSIKICGFSAELKQPLSGNKVYVNGEQFFLNNEGCLEVPDLYENNVEVVVCSYISMKCDSVYIKDDNYVLAFIKEFDNQQQVDLEKIPFEKLLIQDSNLVTEGNQNVYRRIPQD